MEQAKAANQKFLLIAEGVVRGEPCNPHDRTLEMAAADYRDDLMSALGDIGLSVACLAGPDELILNAERFSDYLVMSIYGGERSRNRMALVPAICEAAGIRFMGADVYARIVAQDKYVTKSLVRRFGFQTSPAILVYSPSDLRFLDVLELPLVLKPNFEGSSIGISDSNLVFDYNRAENLARKLLSEFGQPVLVEEFVRGREVSVCVSGTRDGLTLAEAIEVRMVGESQFLVDRLYTPELKNDRSDEFEHVPISAEFPESFWKTCEELFVALGKIDYLRIDGRLSESGFSLIEITPDPYLARSSAFAAAFAAAGMQYSDGIRLLATNSLANY